LGPPEIRRSRARGEQPEVLAPLAQGRDLEQMAGEARIEVRPKLAERNVRAQITVGGADHAKVDLDRASGPERAYLALL
jgi:hypothetical protein